MSMLNPLRRDAGKLTLRQRLTATKAKARQVLAVNKALLTPPPAPPAPPAPKPPEVDADLVRAAYDLGLIDDAIAALSKGPHDYEDAPGYEAVEEARDVILERMVEIPAVALPGLRAKAEALLTRRVGENDEEVISLALSLARDLVRAEGLTIAATHDPVFAVIEENRRAYDAWQATNALPEVPGTLDRPPEALDAAEAFHEQTDTVLLTTVPATAAGCQALARYVAEFQAREQYPLDEDMENRENWRVLDLIARSPLL